MSRVPITLSRLAITGAVTLSTPIVVLKEIADAHSIKYDEDRLNNYKYLVQLINIINTRNVKTVTESFDMQDYKLIARFVNKNRQWTRGTLSNAFYYLLEYTKPERLAEVYTGFSFGLQTPENPTSLNACVLYGICRSNRIDTKFSSTCREMASNIEMLYNLRNPDINHSVRTAIYESMMYGGCEGYQLVNMLSQIDPERSSRIMNLQNSQTSPGTIMHNIENTSDIVIDFEELRLTAADIRRRNIRTLPQRHVDAVAMAAIYYKMDISQAKNPLAEYRELVRTPYFPLDRMLARRLQLSNRHSDSIESPKLDKVFNPELPTNLYEDEDLDNMCLEEGYKQEDIRNESSYTLLQTSWFLETFLHGKQGNITNTENTMLDELNELDYNNVVVYGVRYNDMYFYTYGELSDTFGSFRRFQKPNGNGSLFSTTSIDKLYVLCHKDQRPGETEVIFRERLELAEVIDRVNLYNRNNQGLARVLLDKYESFDRYGKLAVQNVFQQLLHSAMYMRGWRGEGPYPLFRDDTMVSYDEQPNVDLRVTGSIIRLEGMLEDINQYDHIGDTIKELPLIFYHHRSHELLPSTSEEEGLTIIDRINIVKGGEEIPVQSCIRMSSNRFAATAYHYMRFIGLPAPFDIEEMAHIF